MHEVLAAFWHPALPYLYGMALLLAALVARFMADGRGAARHALLLIAAGLLLDLAGAVLGVRQEAAAGRGLHEAALLLLGAVQIRLAGLLLFRAVLPALHLALPRILEDIAVVAGYLLWAMVRLSYAGVELSSLVATSAVITAVLAFAMQDTLGNVLGGLALQLDDSLAIGDWLRLDDVSGRVVEIQWRFTAVLTRNGERVVIPNGLLMKAKFSVIPAAPEGAGRLRRWIGFQIADEVAPSQVAAAAERAIADAEIDNVARTPPPSCVAMDFAPPGAVRYALRYWLVDPRDDDATDSAVRSHLLAALHRQGWRLALPGQALHLMQDDQAHREQAWQRELGRRLGALGAIDLFAALDDAERRQLAERLVPAPFARGDVVTRQGAEAHWLYILVAGEVEVFWETPDGQRSPLTRLAAGSFFGEMGLLTGAPRSATVVASSDVDCYRLDKASFEDILHRRHEIADAIARVLAQRVQHNEALRATFPKPHGDATPADHGAALLRRIREFFGLA